MSNKTIDYLSKDYEGFREDMINKIPRIFDNWTDYSESDAGVVLLELMAYGLDILSYYQDRVANERLLPTATQRQSVIDLCDLIGYELNTAQPSTTELVFEIQPSDSDFVIPAGTKVSTENEPGQDPIIFETDDDLTIPKGKTGIEQDNDGNYLYKVSATQGVTINNDIIGSGTGKPNQTYKLTYSDVIGNDLKVYVDDGNGFQLWTDVTDKLVQDTEDGKHYWHGVDDEDYVWINFGNGSDGKTPSKLDNNIKASYRVGGGSDTNVGSNKITVLKSSIGGVVSVFNPVSATGGTDRETVQEAKKLAPKHLKSVNRAVTKEDFEALALQVPGVLKAFAEQDSNTYNLVHVYVLPKEGTDNTELKNEVYDTLDELKIITTEVQVEDPTQVYADVELDITVNALFDQETIESHVNDVINQLFKAKNKDFGEGEKMYRVYAVLGDMEGIDDAQITKFTNVPQVKWHTVTGDPTWSDITINSSNNLRGTWKVEMIDSTSFEVFFDDTGEFTGSEVSKGTGSFDTQFTSNSGEVTFTISSGSTACSGGDYWTFKTQPYKDNIEIGSKEFINLKNLTLNMSGGS